jgi:hypothetical protein
VVNAGVLLSGELTVVVWRERPCISKQATPNYGINEGKVPAENIFFYAGVVDMPITTNQARCVQSARRLVRDHDISFGYTCVDA